MYTLSEQNLIVTLLAAAAFGFGLWVADLRASLILTGLVLVLNWLISLEIHADTDGVEFFVRGMLSFATAVLVFALYCYMYVNGSVRLVAAPIALFIAGFSVMVTAQCVQDKTR